MSELYHECGVAAIYHLSIGDTSPLCPEGGPAQASRLLPRMLQDIQNRGQLAAGMTRYRSEGSLLLETHKDIGTVSEVFQLSHRSKAEELMEAQSGPAAIGHVATQLADKTIVPMHSHLTGSIFTNTSGSVFVSTGNSRII